MTQSDLHILVQDLVAECGAPSIREMERLSKRAARRTRLSRSTVSEILRGDRLPSQDVLLEIVQVLEGAAAEKDIEIDVGRFDRKFWSDLHKNAHSRGGSDCGGHSSDANNDGGTLESARAAILRRQHEELERELDVYRAIVTNFSRATLLHALRRAADSDVISPAGVRAPIWGTALHYRFVVDSDTELEVRIEHDDGSVVSSHPWRVEMSVRDFLQILVEGVRSAGEDLGTGLNDPTESVEELSGMLVDVTKLRSQELRGLRRLLVHIIERVDGWYFTEFALYPSHQLGYQITVDRLDEIDWEDHLENNKGWSDSRYMLGFARRLYGVAPPRDCHDGSQPKRWRGAIIAPVVHPEVE